MTHQPSGAIALHKEEKMGILVVNEMVGKADEIIRRKPPALVYVPFLMYPGSECILIGRSDECPR